MHIYRYLLASVYVYIVSIPLKFHHFAHTIPLIETLYSYRKDERFIQKKNCAIPYKNYSLAGYF